MPIEFVTIPNKIEVTPRPNKIEFTLQQVAAFCPEYQAILTRAIALGYTLPTFSQQVKQDQLVRALINAGIWSLIDWADMFFTNGDANFGTLNWKAPSLFQATRVNSPTFTPNLGFAGNGSSSYLNSNWKTNNGVNFTQNNAGIYILVTAGNANANSTELGARVSGGSGNSTFIQTATAGGIVTGEVNTVVTGAGLSNANLGTGFYHIKNNGSSTLQVYKNGVFFGNLTGRGIVAVAALNLFIGALNLDGNPTSFSTRTIGFVGAGANLNGKELAFYNAINDYVTNPG